MNGGWLERICWSVRAGGSFAWRLRTGSTPTSGLHDWMRLGIRGTRPGWRPWSESLMTYMSN